MIYYLAVNGCITRSEIAGLLWPEEEDGVAKKNLRNAIYQAKRSVGEDFILSPKKSLLELNPALSITCDATLFAEDPAAHLALYDGPFLQGFYVKEAEQFDYWVTRMRGFYEEKYMAHAYQQLEEAIEAERFENVERQIKTLIAMDEYDERNVRLLMHFYAKTGRTGKVIETYYALKKLLRDELGVRPDAETQRLYETAINRIELSSRKERTHETFFFGRYAERAKILQQIQRIPDGKATSIVLQGEAGIGKSALVRKVLDEAEDDVVVLQAFCYRAEQQYALRPIAVLMERLAETLTDLNVPRPANWESTMKRLFPPLESSVREALLPEALETVNSDTLSKILVEAISRIAEKRALVILLEDVHWMDELSFQVLTTVALRIQHKAMFLVTARLEKNRELENALAILTQYKLVEVIPLSRFTEEESARFINEAVGEEVDARTQAHIFAETEGNPFFLAEYVQLINTHEMDRLMTDEMMDAMKARFAYLSKAEQDLVDLVSFFYDEAPLSVLVTLTGQDELAIIGLLDRLEQINILTERPHQNDIGIRFTHVKLREYTYMVQPESKRRFIHKRIAQIIEESLEEKRSFYSFSKLVYHYSRADEPLKAMHYELETLNYYLNFTHELFPILRTRAAEDPEETYISREKLQALFETLEEKLDALRKAWRGDELNKLEMAFYYMKGRYLIREGVYAEGLSQMRQAIGKAKEVNDRDYMLEGYKQFIYYNIQTNHADEMISYIEGALDLAVQCNYHKEIGILLRLKGLYNIMIGQYETAERLLNESIRTFRVTDEVARRYAINIAAAMNYIGEIRFQMGQYEEALAQFESALELTRDKKALSALSVFYINKGKALYAMGEKGAARETFLAAEGLYAHFDAYWKRPVLESYLALMDIDDGSFAQAAERLTSAIAIAKQMNDPRAEGAAYFAATRFMTEAPEKAKRDAEALNGRTALEYRRAALALLDPNRDHYEIQRLSEAQA
ncbi:MAG: AAA family ATPase [Peptoniphilaceae bacterium]|nr:AAA family ATPase [Peptoniphilaceae bacterium]